MPSSSTAQKRSEFSNGPIEGTFLLAEQPILLRHDSEFSVSSNYDYSSPNNLSVWQGATLLTAECLGTGLLALPADIHLLGYGLGLGFLIANLPINLYAGTILSFTASSVEDRQKVENLLYTSSLNEEFDYDEDIDYLAINADTINSAKSAVSIITTGTNHTRLHHDTATFDFIGICQALFGSKMATRFVMFIYYLNIFLVLGNYILVMSHAVAAVFGDDLICLPIAGLIATTGMFAVSQLRTMARLGRTASILSLAALVIVVIQCLWEAQQSERLVEEIEAIPPSHPEHPSLFRKLSALGSIGFAVGSQKLFLNIRHELTDRSDAPRSLAMALTVFGTVYVLIVLAAGSNPPSFLFDAIPPGINRRIAGFLLWGHVVVSFAINSQALCSSIDRLVWHRLEMPAYFHDAATRWLLLTFAVGCTAYIVANAIPFFKDLVGLIGALTSVPLTLLLPALFWRKHLSVSLWRPTTDSLFSATLTSYSVIFIVTATTGALYSIQQDWSTHGPPFSCR